MPVTIPSCILQHTLAQLRNEYPSPKKTEPYALINDTTMSGNIFDAPVFNHKAQT